MAEEEVIVTSKFQLKRGLAENWTDQNPILLEGEPGAEIDTGRLKIGDGTTAWVDLPYTSNLPDINVMHFKGLVDTDPTEITTGYNPGDVVLYKTREYVWATSENEPTTYKFRELGNEEDIIESPNNLYRIWNLPQGFHRFTYDGEITFQYHNNTEPVYTFNVDGPTTGSIYIRSTTYYTYYTYSIIGSGNIYQGQITTQIINGQTKVTNYIDLRQVAKSAIVNQITEATKERTDLIPNNKAVYDFVKSNPEIPTIEIAQSQIISADVIQFTSEQWDILIDDDTKILFADAPKISPEDAKYRILYKCSSYGQLPAFGPLYYEFNGGSSAGLRLITYSLNSNQRQLKMSILNYAYLDVNLQDGDLLKIDGDLIIKAVPDVDYATPEYVQAALYVDEDAEVN